MNIPMLGVNIDHVATIRQARMTFEPDPVTAAALATLAGADIITLHVREDRRHVQDRDLEILRKTVFTRLNLEMALVDPMVKLAIDTFPDQVTLVPEKRQELTTEGGLDVISIEKGRGDEGISRMRDAGIRVSIFVDPDPAQIQACAAVGAECVELHTGPYANSKAVEREEHLYRLERAVAAAVDAGLIVNAGHGLNYANTAPLVRRIGIEELHIGHSIISRAVLVGMERAVREMKEIIRINSVRA